FSILRFNKTIKTAYRIRSIIKQYNIDVIHILYAEPNALWANFKFLFKTPLILTTRGTDILKTIADFSISKRLIGKISFFLYRRAFNNFDQITSTSENQKRLIESWVPKVKVKII